MWLLTLGLKLYERGLNIFSSAFSLRLLTSIIPDKGSLLSFTRSTEATMPDHEGLVKLCKPNEARFYGARRVKNFFSPSLVTFGLAGTGEVIDNADGSYTCKGLSLGDRAHLSINASSIIDINEILNHKFVVSYDYVLHVGDNPTSALYTITAAAVTGNYAQVASASGSRLANTTPSEFAATNGSFRIGVGVSTGTTEVYTVTISNIQIEDVTGKAIQEPSEYISVGVGTEPEILSDPDFSNTAVSETPADITFTAAGILAYKDINNRLVLDRNDSAATTSQVQILNETDFVEGRLYLIELDIYSILGAWDLLLFGEYVVNVSTAIGKQRFIVRAGVSSALGLRIGLRNNNLANVVLNSYSIKEIQHGSNVDGVKYLPYENGNTVDVNNVVVEEQGAPLTTMQGYLNEPGSTNSCLQSRNFGLTPWILLGGTSTLVQDKVGIDGVPNTAWTLSDTDITAKSLLRQTVNIADDNSTHCSYIHILKDNNESRIPEVQMTLINGAVHQNIAVQLNTKTGETFVRTSTGTVTLECELVGLYWVLKTSVANVANGNGQLQFNVYPAMTSVFGGAENTLTGSIVIDQVQIELYTKFTSSPIYTTTEAVARSADTLLYDFQPNPLHGAMLATVNRTYHLLDTSYYIATNALSLFLFNHQSTGGQPSTYEGNPTLRYSVATAGLQSDTYGLTWDKATTDEKQTYKNGVAGLASALAVNGYAVDADKLGIGCLGSTGTGQHIGCYRDIKFYNTAPSKFIMEDSTK